MNIHQTSPRPDCTHFAKCGERSIAYCRRYGEKECASCNLVKRKPRNRVITDGVELNYVLIAGKPFRCTGFITGQYIGTVRAII